jgi:hypothetical protein
MLYERTWFNHDRQSLTIGGGQINNPGRYLVLTPIINEATALNNSPYFSQNPGDPYKAMDGTITFQYSPRQFITYLAEYGYRHASVPYWTGRKGMTPPGATTQTPVGSSSDYICTNNSSSVDSGQSLGVSSPAQGPTNITGGTIYSAAQGAKDIPFMKSYCAANFPNTPLLWQPDLRKDEQKLTFALMVKF